MKSLAAFVLTASLWCLCVASPNGLTEPHLIGGTIVSPLEHQYSVGLKITVGLDDERLCGAARISEDWFVTAAECLKKNSIYIPYKILITYPAYPQYGQIEYMHLENLKTVIHPAFNEENKENNIGLFYINRTYLSEIDQIPSLPEKEDATFVDKPATITAWKVNTGPTFKIYPNMNGIETVIIEPSLCKALYLFASLPENYICASGLGNKGLSEDDVGVPLVVKSDNKLTLVGIGSSIRPQQSNLPLPMVFTSLNPYTKWIREEMKKAEEEDF